MKLAAILFLLCAHAVLSVRMRSKYEDAADDVSIDEYNDKYGSKDGDKEVYFVEEDEEDSQGRSLAMKAKMLKYGCWCGEGNGCTSVKDAVDKVCKTHDKCYEAKGARHCSCEKQMCNDMVAAMVHPEVGPEGKAAAVSAHNIFCNKPCYCTKCVPWLCCGPGWKCKGCKKCTKLLHSNHKTCKL